jgi:Zn-dependent protease
MNWWMADVYNSQGMPFLVSWVVWVVVSIVLHELGHGYAAIRCGDDTPKYLGHMTINPFVHIPGMAWILFVLLGMTYGLMPVNPTNFNGRYDDAKVAFAGPLVNLVLGVMCVIAAALWLRFGGAAPDQFRENLGNFFVVGAAINTMGFFFNLIPVPPLDGSRILGNFVPAYRRVFEAQYGGLIAMVAFGLLFAVGSKYVWALSFGVAYAGIALVSGLLGVPLGP